MASSSSAKKVARVAARSGGGAKANKQANWLFPAAIVVIVVLGAVAVLYARSENGGGSDNSTAPRANLNNGKPFDHWHASFAVNVCGKELPAPNDVQDDILGIHSHGDGLIHIHPFTTRASGNRATLAKFFDQEGIKVTNSGFEVPKAMAPEGGTTIKEGETTCGGKPGEVVLAHWKDARTAASQPPDDIRTTDFGGEQLTENFGAYTLAFEVKGDRTIPAPSSSANIEQLGTADGGTTPGNAPNVDGTTIPSGGGAPVPGGDPTGAGVPTPSAPSGSTPTVPAAGG